MEKGATAERAVVAWVRDWRGLAAERIRSGRSTDPGASASLDELVAVNIAGDIEAVARSIGEQRTIMLREWVGGEFPLPPMANWLQTWEVALNVVAAGIREAPSGE